MDTVWQELNHDSILNAVEETLGTKLSSMVLKRNSYINRVFELEKQKTKERFIVKFYRPLRWTQEMILEEHKFLKELNAQEIPVIPPLEFRDETLFTSNSSLNAMRYALFPKKGGRALDEFDAEAWEMLGRLMARVHAVGALHKESLRITWKPAVATRQHLETLLGSSYVLPDFKNGLENIAALFIINFEPMFEMHELILLHGDAHKGNLIHRPGEGIYIVDFDDICIGPPVQDLWMLLPGEIRHFKRELEWFLKGYETFRPFDRNSLELIPALRGMRLIHFAAWLAIQSEEPDFSAHFSHAGGPKYWNELIKELQEIVYGGE
jgi:Ser/Thr protein kinase RdoA (MazF antagonist)